MCFTQCHMQTPTADATTTIAASVCPRCGTIAKSGKLSCCGRGGSWFKNCGGVGNTKFQHTWHEGMHACKARTQSKAIIAHQKGTDSSQGVDMANRKPVVKPVAFMPVNTSTLTSDTTSIVTSSLTDHMVVAAVMVVMMMMMA